MTITLRVNQIVVGLGITIAAHAMCSFLHRVIFGKQFPILFTAGTTDEIPLLSQIPIIGQPLFNQHWLLYVTFLLVPVLWWLMYKTSFGLRVRAVGDTPWAADASGVSVFRTRYLACLIGGLLAGLGGAFLSLGDLAFFVPDMIQGRGYIAIVVVMLGKWNPVWGGRRVAFVRPGPVANQRFAGGWRGCQSGLYFDDPLSGGNFGVIVVRALHQPAGGAVHSLRAGT